MQKQNQHNVDSILDKLKRHLRAETDQQLAIHLGVSPQVLSNWRSRKRVDYALIIDFSKRKNIDLDWLFNDRSSENSSEPDNNKRFVNEEASCYGVQVECKTCKAYEKMLQKFEVLVHQQGRTIDLLTAEMEHLRKLYELIMKKTDNHSF